MAQQSRRGRRHTTYQAKPGCQEILEWFQSDLYPVGITLEDLSTNPRMTADFQILQPSIPGSAPRVCFGDQSLLLETFRRLVSLTSPTLQDWAAPKMEANVLQFHSCAMIVSSMMVGRTLLQLVEIQRVDYLREGDALLKQSGVRLN